MEISAKASNDLILGTAVTQPAALARA
jgi:hypothetical protein